MYNRYPCNPDPRPKRRRASDNPYEIFTVGRDTPQPHYYLSFTDSCGEKHRIEISKTLFDAFDSFELDDLSFLNEMDRHYEHSELSEASLHKRVSEQGESIEDTILRQLENETLCLAIDALPEIQRRRLTLYYFGELTYEQIAEMEGCTKRAVKFSVDIAIEKLKKFFDF